MILLGIALFFAAILCGLALRANVRFQDAKRLPMQWGLNGEPTWHAPRAVALAFIPALSICVFIFHMVLAWTLEPRPGQEHLVIPVLVGLGAISVAIQWLHIWMVAKTLRRKGG